MTTDQIDKMIDEWAKERAIYIYASGARNTTRTDFQALVRMSVEAEREACAKVADTHQVRTGHSVNNETAANFAARNIAAAIRNRKEQP